MRRIDMNRFGLISVTLLALLITFLTSQSPSLTTHLGLFEPRGASAAPLPKLPYTPVVTPNGSTLPFQMKQGVKEFRLVAEPVKREFAPGMVVNAWGYNGSTPGPTIEAVEGDRVRIYVTNKLPR
jgi:FtsP/CotA-like multicopper oxidase with cupredoxin domain